MSTDDILIRVEQPLDIHSCDTIVHTSNRIPLATAIGVGVRQILSQLTGPSAT